LDGRDRYRHRLAVDAIYRATYQRELVRTLGVEWTAADIHGNRELQGIPEDLVRAFSKRTGEIDGELDRLAADGRERTPRLVKWAVHTTRKPKQHEAPDTLYGRWRAEAAERGHDPDTVVREVTDRTPDRDHDRTVSDAVAGQLFDRLAGPEGLTEHASTFARPDVLVALGAGLAGAGRSELEALADRFVAERAVSVVADRALEQRRWSTPELLGVEQRLVAAATGRADEPAAVVSHQAVGEALARPTVRSWHPGVGWDASSPVLRVEADQRTRQGHQPQQDVGAALVADLQPPGADQPRQRPLHHRWRPRRWLGSMPRRAILGLIPRRRSARRQRGESYPLSPWSLAGRLRGRPGRACLLDRWDGVDTASSSMESWVLAADRQPASGMPRRSTNR
jgi:hypothetical protein